MNILASLDNRCSSSTKPRRSNRRASRLSITKKSVFETMQERRNQVFSTNEDESLDNSSDSDSNESVDRSEVSRSEVSSRDEASESEESTDDEDDSIDIVTNKQHNNALSKRILDFSDEDDESDDEIVSEDEVLSEDEEIILESDDEYDPQAEKSDNDEDDDDSMESNYEEDELALMVATRLAARKVANESANTEKESSASDSREPMEDESLSESEQVVVSDKKQPRKRASRVGAAITKAVQPKVPVVPKKGRKSQPKKVQEPVVVASPNSLNDNSESVETPSAKPATRFKRTKASNKNQTIGKRQTGTKVDEDDSVFASDDVQEELADDLVASKPKRSRAKKQTATTTNKRQPATDADEDDSATPTDDEQDEIAADLAASKPKRTRAQKQPATSTNKHQPAGTKSALALLTNTSRLTKKKVASNSQAAKCQRKTAIDENDEEFIVQDTSGKTMEVSVFTGDDATLAGNCQMQLSDDELGGDNVSAGESCQNQFLESDDECLICDDDEECVSVVAEVFEDGDFSGEDDVVAVVVERTSRVAKTQKQPSSKKIPLKRQTKLDINKSAPANGETRVRDLGIELSARQGDEQNDDLATLNSETSVANVCKRRLYNGSIKSRAASNFCPGEMGEDDDHNDFTLNDPSNHEVLEDEALDASGIDAESKDGMQMHDFNSQNSCKEKMSSSCSIGVDGDIVSCTPPVHTRGQDFSYTESVPNAKACGHATESLSSRYVSTLANARDEDAENFRPESVLKLEFKLRDIMLDVSSIDMTSPVPTSRENDSDHEDKAHVAPCSTIAIRSVEEMVSPLERSAAKEPRTLDEASLKSPSVLLSRRLLLDQDHSLEEGNKSLVSRENALPVISDATSMYNLFDGLAISNSSSIITCGKVLTPCAVDEVSMTERFNDFSNSTRLDPVNFESSVKADFAVGEMTGPAQFIHALVPSVEGAVGTSLIKSAIVAAESSQMLPDTFPYPVAKANKTHEVVATSPPTKAFASLATGSSPPDTPALAVANVYNVLEPYTTNTKAPPMKSTPQPETSTKFEESLGEPASEKKFVSFDPDVIVKETTKARRMCSQHIQKGHWKLGAEIGSGAFGVVHKAFNHKTGKIMAVKSFKMEKAIMEDVRREVEMLKILNHVNIVLYYGAEKNDKDLHIFTEWMAGGSITQLLSDYGPFSFPVLRSYMAQLIEGLAYLHGHGIMHRDIKGSNILVGKDGDVKIADFGASKKLLSDLAFSHTMRGTPYFMAPEVFEENYSFQADIWSVGCVGFQMATGEAPWKDLGVSNPVALFNLVKKQCGPPKMKLSTAADQNPFVIASFRAMIADCIQADPKKRPNCQQLLKCSFLANDSFSDDDETATQSFHLSPGRPTSYWEDLTSPTNPESVSRSNSDSFYFRSSLSRNQALAASSPQPDTSDWPTWAHEEGQRATAPTSGMLETLAYSTDSSSGTATLVGAALVNSLNTVAKLEKEE